METITSEDENENHTETVIEDVIEYVTVTSEDEKENYNEPAMEDAIEYVAEDVLESEREDIPDNNSVVLAKSNETDSSHDGPVIIVVSVNLNEPHIIDNVQFAIDKSKGFLIGRNKEAAIDIKHQAISRDHCLIDFKKDQAMVENLSSLGMLVNRKYLKKKNQTCSLNNGYEIILSKYLPEFVLKFYEKASHIPAEEMKILTKNMAILNRKRKIESSTLDSENVVDAKRSRQNNQNKRQELQQEKINLETSFSKRLSTARKSYDTRMECYLFKQNCYVD
uniref:FHA domain-containing protein n=1 Tax=Cacopsylla melanoneura TaxID=428564 RepID=A0A8D8U141_9HEMI